jgi:hypothetical protein
MGCDIHAYIDYDEPDGHGGIRTYNFAHVKFNRNYWLFTLLASVRGDNVQGHAGRLPKGVPPQMSYQVRNDYYFQVVDDNDPVIEAGIGRIGREYAKKKKYKFVGEHHCENSDHHSISYMNLEELDEVIADYMGCKELLHVIVPSDEALREGDVVRVDNAGGNRLVERVQPVTLPYDLAAIREAMAALKKNGVEPRFIFWFDN